ncbi:MAG: hypothetical protein ACREV5_12735 [Steroidobacter sp.]
MSSTSSPTLIIDVRARGAERSVVAGTLVLAAFAPWILTTPPPLGAFFLSLVSLLLLTWGFGRCGWLPGRRRIETVSWVADNRWILTDGSGSTSEATLGPGSRVGRRMIWLQWRPMGAVLGHTHSILLTAFDIPEQDLRRLGVRLRIEGLSRGESAPVVVA